MLDFALCQPRRSSPGSELMLRSRYRWQGVARMVDLNVARRHRGIDGIQHSALHVESGGRMEISAEVRNSDGAHEVAVVTSGLVRGVAVPAKGNGRGSSVNGGEFLMLALATCYCNDLYREAERLGISITGCEVVAKSRFNGIGLAAEAVTYSARVESSASAEDIERLLTETDRLAEIHNTLRAGCPVQRVAWHDGAS
jgi:organic hydroperoxide reductase OsmC/OhrA